VGEKKVIKVLIEGGQATAGPPLGPSLGPLGVNVLMVVNKINELTKDFGGMRVPVKVIVDVGTKEFEVEVGLPTTAALIARELGVEKGSGLPATEKVGDLKMEQVVRIAKVKARSSLSTNLESVVKEVLGTCLSMGVTIEGKDPRDAIRDLEGGEYALD
jgi:large subunit ribosomal protein L11